MAPAVCRQIGFEAAHAFNVEKAQRISRERVEHVTKLRAGCGFIHDPPTALPHLVRLDPRLEGDFVRQVESFASGNFIKS